MPRSPRHDEAPSSFPLVNLTPLYDYLSFLSGRYGIAIVAVTACLSILPEIFSKTDEKPRLLAAVGNIGPATVGLVGMGFFLFTFYKSYTGVIYEFWPLTFSYFLSFYSAFCSLILMETWKDGIRGVVITLIMAAILCLLFSPMVVGMLRLFEGYHPLWP
jgi:hypothetical protein